MNCNLNMKLVTFSILLLQLASVIYVCGEKISLSRDGEDFNIQLAPFQVLVVKTPVADSAAMCRGALVKNNALVTSALCISKLSKEPKDLLVLNGRATNQTYWINSTISKITPHPKFNSSLTINNIAVIHLNKTFSSKPISYSKNPPKDNTGCKAYSYKLKPPSVVDVNTTCVHMCQKAYNASTPRYNVDIDTMLCTNDTNNKQVICENDVGASLVCDNVLTGLAVYSQECINNKMASVFVSIPPYAKWIDSTINSSSINSMSSLSVIMGTIISFSITKLLSR